MKKELQKRMVFMTSGLHVREDALNSIDNRTIEGCAIVFNKETILYEGKYYREREIILSSCITEDFLKTQDIKLNLLHERSDSLARNNKGEGTLNLELRSDGLYFSVDLPECDLGDRALALIRNKTYTGCSFEFYPKEFDIKEEVDDNDFVDSLIIHKEFYQVTALTIAMDPAYIDTSISEAREVCEKKETDIITRRQKKVEEEESRIADEKAKELREQQHQNLLRDIDRDIDYLSLQS